MTYVAINVLTVPEAGGAVLEERFAARRQSVLQPVRLHEGPLKQIAGQ